MKHLTLLIFLLLLSACTTLSEKQRLAQGKQLSFQRNKGNCLACHVIDNGIDPGNIGPALTHIPERFTNKAQLSAIIWDATQFNLQTSMPPFGKNKILTTEELERVVDYIWSLD